MVGLKSLLTTSLHESHHMHALHPLLPSLFFSFLEASGSQVPSSLSLREPMPMCLCTPGVDYLITDLFILLAHSEHSARLILLDVGYSLSLLCA